MSTILFRDISNFNNTTDYLPILNACINTDLLALFLLHIGILHSKWLRLWYKKYLLSACITDVTILFLCIILTRFLYNYIFSTFSIWYFLLLAIGVQFTHDILFYIFFMNVPYGFNQILDFFKGYAKDSGFRALFGNSIMICVASLMAANFATFSFNQNIILLAISIYFIPYMIYT